MKKEKSIKKKNNASKSKLCKPFFDNRKLLTIAIASFFIFAFLLNFVNVTETNATITGQPVRENAGFIADMFADWSAGTMDVNIAKYLFFGMLILLIFSVLNAVSIPDNTALQWLIAIPISFLSVAYITPQEVFSILSAYTALGILFSVAAPFGVILLASSMLVSPKKGKMTAGKILSEMSLWGAYIIILGYKLIKGFGKGSGASPALNAVIGGFLVIAVLIFIFNKNFRKAIRNLGLEIKKGIAKEDLTESEISRVRSALEKQDVNVSKDLTEGL